MNIQVSGQNDVDQQDGNDLSLASFESMTFLEFENFISVVTVVIFTSRLLSQVHVDIRCFTMLRGLFFKLAVYLAIALVFVIVFLLFWAWKRMQCNQGKKNNARPVNNSYIELAPSSVDETSSICQDIEIAENTTGKKLKSFHQVASYAKLE